MNLRVVDAPLPAGKAAKPAAIGHAGERNPGFPLDLDWVGRVRMNRSAQPLPSGSLTKLGELTIPRKLSSRWKPSLR